MLSIGGARSDVKGARLRDSTNNRTPFAICKNTRLLGLLLLAIKNLAQNRRGLLLPDQLHQTLVGAIHLPEAALNKQMLGHARSQPAQRPQTRSVLLLDLRPQACHLALLVLLAHRCPSLTGEVGKPSVACTTARRSSTLNGLHRCSCAPTRRLFRRSATPARREGGASRVRRRGGSVRRWRATSWPSMPGSPIPSSTRAGWVASAE